LQKTWKGIGCTRDMRSTYYDQAHSHVKDLLNDMVAETQSKQQLLFANIQDFIKQTTALYAELQMEMIPKMYDHVPLYKVKQILQIDLQTLECLKKEHIVIFKEFWRIIVEGIFQRRTEKEGKSLSPVNSIVDTTYNQFQGYMTAREELHSSMLPEQILRSTNRININKTPVRTPMKPLRKHLSATTTPSFTPLSARKTPHSPRVINIPKLATAPSNLPFIF
ncbi:hypothetical protein ALC60_08214, partial [Trachymyrmex zeteki]